MIIKFQNFDNFGRVLRELYVTTDPLYLVKKGSMSVEGENMLMLGEFIYIYIYNCKKTKMRGVQSYQNIQQMIER